MDAINAAVLSMDLLHDNYADIEKRRRENTAQQHSDFVKMIYDMKSRIEKLEAEVKRLKAAK